MRTARQEYVEGFLEELDSQQVPQDPEGSRSSSSEMATRFISGMQGKNKKSLYASARSSVILGGLARTLS